MKFVSRYAVETPVALVGWREKQGTLRHGISFFPKDIAFSMECSEWLEDYQDARSHRGLMFDVSYDAPSYEDAICRHSGFSLAATGVLLCSFATGCAIPDPHHLYTYSRTDDIKRDEIDMHATIPLLPPLLPYPELILLDKELFKALMTNVGPQPWSLRLAHSFRWYKASLEKNDRAEKFICLWTGLIPLEKPLREKYLLPEKTDVKAYPRCAECKEDITICNHCNRDIGRAPKEGELIGLTHFATSKLGWEKKKIDQLHAFCSKLLKSGEMPSLEEIKEMEERWIPELRELYLYAACDLSGIEEHAETMVTRMDLGIPHIPNLIARLRATHPAAPKEQIDQQPDFRASFQLDGIGTMEGRFADVKITVKEETANMIDAEMIEKPDIDVFKEAKRKRLHERIQNVQKHTIERKVGRNDPCPCGAMKEDGVPIKYKKCHGR